MLFRSSYPQIEHFGKGIRITCKIELPISSYVRNEKNGKLRRLNLSQNRFSSDQLESIDTG